MKKVHYRILQQQHKKCVGNARIITRMLSDWRSTVWARHCCPSTPKRSISLLSSASFREFVYSFWLLHAFLDFNSHLQKTFVCFMWRNSQPRLGSFPELRAVKSICRMHWMTYLLLMLKKNEKGTGCSSCRASEPRFHGALHMTGSENDLWKHIFLATEAPSDSFNL